MTLSLTPLALPPGTPSIDNIAEGEEGGDHEECNGGVRDGGGSEVESHAQVMVSFQ